MGQSARRRVLAALACGAAAAAVVAWFTVWRLTVLVAWDVAALVVLVRVWRHIWNHGPGETRAFAARDDDARRGSEVLLLLACTASLVGVAFAYLKAQEGGYEEALRHTVARHGLLSFLLCRHPRRHHRRRRGAAQRRTIRSLAAGRDTRTADAHSPASSLPPVAPSPSV